MVSDLQSFIFLLLFLLILLLCFWAGLGSVGFPYDAFCFLRSPTLTYSLAHSPVKVDVPVVLRGQRAHGLEKVALGIVALLGGRARVGAALLLREARGPVGEDLWAHRHFGEKGAGGWVTMPGRLGVGTAVLVNR